MAPTGQSLSKVAAIRTVAPWRKGSVLLVLTQNNKYKIKTRFCYKNKRDDIFTFFISIFVVKKISNNIITRFSIVCLLCQVNLPILNNGLFRIYTHFS